jgi:DNA topoisomerase VI subunit B
MLTLTQEDWKRYMTPEGLSEKAGVPQSRFRELIVKELIDNACDIGGGRMFSKGDDILEVHDNGSGVPLEALSIKRPLVSSKHWRRGERGALGNGLRVVMGALYCLGGQRLFRRQ